MASPEGTSVLRPRNLRDLSRSLRTALSHSPGEGSPPAALELSGLVLDPPRIGECQPVEGDSLSAIALEASGEVGFRAFLDGAQRSTIADYAGTVPIVAGRIAAVVRVRVDRRMTTWTDGHLAAAHLYAPLRLLPYAVREGIESSGLELRDTLKPDDELSGHPIELLRRAVDRVKLDREQLEQRLAEQWVRAMDEPLFVDGGLPVGERAAVSPMCVGVIKSHHTIYAPGDTLSIVLGLREDERSSVFVVKRSWGPPVLSWYLRLRESPSHDPFMGLVRVEVARTTDGDLPARADRVSQWILAERAPLALPDARWDRMVYGIRDCEEYLRATTS